MRRMLSSGDSMTRSVDSLLPNALTMMALRTRARPVDESMPRSSMTSGHSLLGTTCCTNARKKLRFAGTLMSPFSPNSSASRLLMPSASLVAVSSGERREEPPVFDMRPSPAPC
jgi:hypothetical protein